MIRKILLPAFMGAAMGLMMLWMLHMQLLESSALGLGALAAFVGVHIVVIAIIAILPPIASPRLRHFLMRLHRPNVRHMAVMLASATLAIGSTHILLHSGVF
ncbi:hypothetical protein [uncultured Tateyamaria sp.]|uniref:hypothetical protein n=1 Tax=uncultured Tateyamaria sp. TaxID=455651 RepID=UPI00262C00DE|nr:hypothetical protein [uncultured Tateyamaria sp.]